MTVTKQCDAPGRCVALLLSGSCGKGWQALDVGDFLGCRGVLRLIKVPGKLEIEPELSLHAKEPFEAEGCIGRHAAFAVDQFVDARVGNADCASQPLHARDTTLGIGRLPVL